MHWSLEAAMVNLRSQLPAEEGELQQDAGQDTGPSPAVVEVRMYPEPVNPPVWDRSKDARTMVSKRRFYSSYEEYVANFRKKFQTLENCVPLKDVIGEMEIRRLVKSGVAFPEAIESVAQVTEEVLREYLAPVTVGELDDITPRIQAAVNAVYWKFDEPFVHAVTEFAADVLLSLIHI